MQRINRDDVAFQDVQVSFYQLLDAWLPVFEEANTGVSLGAYLRLKYNEHVSYCQMTINPSDYDNARSFFLDYQCIKLFSKYDRLNTGINTTRVAAEEFARCEQKCWGLNKTIVTKGFRSLFTNDEWPVIWRTIRIIQSIMGDAPSLKDLNCYFGPGGSVGLDIRKTSAYDKLSADRSITADLLTMVRDITLPAPRWDSCTSGIPDDDVVGEFSPLTGWQLVPGSRLSFVPKNAKTDRPICIEPLYNGFVQLGFGKYLRQRLRRWAVDLDDQTHNQELARLGSLTGDELATLDLKSASDLIAYEVVRELLPSGWFFMLASARSPTFTIENRTFPLGKFSSMGNGFTFELESLIFYSVSLAVKEHLGSVFTVSAYGDDLVIPTECTLLTTTLLEKLGFEVNTSKSYSQGPFRESCGKDYFNGVNVRPYFQKTGSWQAVISAHNNVVLRHSACFKKISRNLKRLLPKDLRNYGPYGYGDGHLVTERRPTVDRRYKARGWEVTSFWSVTSRSIRRPVSGAAVLPYALYKGARDVRTATMSEHKLPVPRDRYADVARNAALFWEPQEDSVTLVSESRNANFHTRRDDVRYNIRRLHLPWREPLYLAF